MSRSTRNLLLIALAVVVAGALIVLFVSSLPRTDATSAGGGSRGGAAPGDASSRVTAPPALGGPADAAPSQANQTNRTKPTLPTDLSQEDGEPIPTPKGGPKNWSGGEGLQPHEIEELARNERLTIPVFLEMRKTAMMIEYSQDGGAIESIIGRQLTDGERAELAAGRKESNERAAAIVEKSRSGEASEDQTLDALEEVQREFEARYRKATGMSEEDFTKVYPDPLP